MKQSQNQHQGGTSGQTGTVHHGTGGHSRTATQHEHHGYRHSRDGVESQPHGQRSKSTSHNHQQAYHSRENGHSSATGQHESMSMHGRSSHQPRSHSQVKGPSTSSNTTRDNHHQTTQPASSHQTGSNANNSNTAATKSTTHTSSNANAVGHYILGKALGEGTFGKVKLGTHVLTGEKVAVKVLEKSKIKDKKDVERISREIKILKQLHHPNVVQIYEIIETDKDLYLVMEFASGGELFELIVQNQKLKERTASKHLQELLAGVHYIHQLGICHRDLKPENLLLDFDGQLKIVDFGLSNMYEKSQTLKTACGSPCYAAPEMIAGNRYHGLKSDIWSCGVVLYAMLCGYLPFEDQKTSNLYKKIMNAEYQLPKFLSTDAKDILSKIFVTDPNKRIDIDGLKQHPWYKLYQPENQNYGYHTMTRSVNDKLVMKMEASLGFSIDSVQRAVENNKHNHLSATYYLLLKKYAQASYKSNQAARCSSMPSRVDARNSDYQAAKRRDHNKTTVQNTSNSDTKNRAGQVSNENQTSSSGKSAPSSSSVAGASNKYNKFRSKPENDRLKAPVQDQLVLKNHRREQSANATAGRHNRNNEWGSVEDERRTESYGRPAPASDEYEIVISKVNKPTTAATQAEEKKNVDGLRDSQNFNQNMRAHFASPSPDIGPNGTRGGNNRHNSSSNQGKQGSNNSQAPGIQKLMATEAKTKPMEVVNIQNLKQQYNQTGSSSASQTHGRTSSVVKQALPKPATYTQATVTSSQRGGNHNNETAKQKQSQKVSTQAGAEGVNSTSGVHRKTKSIIAPEIVYKQNSEQNPSTQNRDSLNRTLIDPGYAQDHAKFSQTQKIQNLSKSSGQQPRQQSISVSANAPPTNQTAKVSDLISNLNMMSQQKTYFDQITGKSSSQAAQTNNSTGTNNLSKTGGYIPSKQSSAEQAAGIEGSNVSQGEPVVNVNKNGGGATSSGIFQSLTSVVQRPIIQDMNSQNLLKRLESGNSDNALRQNFVNRQSQQSNKRSNEHQGTKGDKRNNKSSPSRKDENGKRSNLQVENPKSQLSNISQTNTNFGGKPISKTPVTGYQTLDTMGDMSSHELKIPVNLDTDRGVSKSIFYGTQKMANLNQEIQRFSNDKISGISTNQVRDFSKTQAVRTISGYHSRSNTGQLNERSTKNVTQRAESQNRPQSGASQTKYAHTSKHSRQSTSTAMSVGNNKRHENTGNDNARTHLGSHQRQSNNGYNIPTQAQTQPTVSNTNAYSTVKNSSQKFQSLKVNSAVKVSAHIVPSQTIEAQTMSSKQGISGNYAQLLQQTVANNAAKKSQAVQKTRSLSVSAAQKGSNMYTPASHRKGNSSNQTNNLLMSQPNAQASATLTAHYRCSTASSTNKERRSSQPPHQTNNNNNLGPQAMQSMSIQAGASQNPHPSKQRSASSTNYQSAFLVKSLDGSRPDTLAATQRTRQKSTRDSSNMNSSFIQQIPQDRQFQSITHTGGLGANTSILSAPIDETVFNQSFNGGHYSNNHHANSSTYTKRRQQVSNINELLSVAETLRHNSNGYQVRTRASNNGANQMKSSQNDVRQPQSNNYMLSSQHQNLLLSQTQKTGQHKQTNNKPIIVDLGPSQQPASAIIQNELKASLLLSQHSLQQQQNQTQAAQNNNNTRGVSQATKQQDLTTAMKQITDGLLQRQQNPSLQQSSQHVQPAYQSHQNQSYLSDMFSKQQQQSQQNNQTNQLFKKNPAKTTVGVNGGVNNLATSLYGQQTQQVNLKSGIYSPTSNSRSKPQSYNNTIDVHHTQQQSQPDSTSFSAYQHRSFQQYGNSQQSAPNGKKQQSSTIEHSIGQPAQQNHSVPSYGVHPQNHQQIQQIQQQHQSSNGQQPGYSGYYPQQYYQAVQQQSHGGYQSQIVGKDLMNNVSSQQQQPATFNLLQHHQNTIQQLSGSYQGSASANLMSNNFMPPQQLAVNMHHNNYSNSHHPHQYQSVPQPQKPPSVPAPSTAYQQMLQQQQHQSNNGMNFYPSQGGSNSQPYN